MKTGHAGSRQFATWMRRSRNWASIRWTASCWTWPSGRRLPGLFLHGGRAAGYAHGPQRGASGTPPDAVNTWPQEELKRILYRVRRRSALRPGSPRPIVRRREQAPIETTLELVEVIKSRHASRRPAGEAAPRQAELSGHPHRRQRRAGRRGAHGWMTRARCRWLNRGGRLAVITFHSSGRPDREADAAASRDRVGPAPRSSRSASAGGSPRLRLVNRKPIVSGAEELERRIPGHAVPNCVSAKNYKLYSGNCRKRG